MPRELSTRLEALGATLTNTKGEDTCGVERRLITGTSPQASDRHGKLASTTLLDHLVATS